MSHAPPAARRRWFEYMTADERVRWFKYTTPEQLVAYVADLSRRYGFPEKCEDPTTLALVASTVATGSRDRSRLTPRTTTQKGSPDE